MTQRIHLLDSLTIDKIAAGEVIDVPASCVKELVENSLDAGAREILVEIRLGGRELIRVSDDGCGMGREDVLSSIERHTTSKLCQIEDLDQLSSRGFRGEALASIVAISRVMITSAEQTDGSVLCPATTLVAAGGETQSVTQTTRTVGTTVEVASLFYNVPARRKFLKSPSKDTTDIIKTITFLALTAPSVAFRLLVDGHQLLYVEAEPERRLIGRIQSLLKEPFISNGIPVSYTKEGIAIEGIIVDPRHVKANRSGQYLVVNGRSVQSLPISYAVKAAFGTACDDRKHPVFALCLTLDPASIDANVHPQKREVRFADEEWVRVMIQEAVSEALFGKTLFSASNRETIDLSPPAPAYCSEPVAPWQPHLIAQPSLFEEGPPLTAPMCKALIGDLALIQPNRELPLPLSSDALLVLDLRQTLRAVMIREFEQPSELSETLLLPIPIECSLQEAQILLQNLKDFERLGFSIRPFGPTTFLIESLPQRFRESDVAEFVLKAIHEGLFTTSQGFSEARNRRLATLYVSTTRALRHPVMAETALAIFERWAQKGYPLFSPEGVPCCSTMCPSSLREWMAKSLCKGS